MTTNYEKKLLNEIKELKEGNVPREILFAERSAHRREIAALQKEGKWRDALVSELEAVNKGLQRENGELKRNGGFVGDYATATSANALLARQKDSELKKLKEENEELKGQLEDDTRQVHQLWEENEKLKDEMEKRLLETQFTTWREGEIDKNGEVDPADDCAYLNLYSDNQELIKEIFDDTWGPLGWEEEWNLSYDVETHLFEELPEYDKEADE